MKRILIAYANEPMRYSLKQIGIQARYIKQIDKVLLYTEKDLPQEIRQSPLMKYKRGGGYWVWKPYLIWKTLQDYPEGFAGKPGNVISYKATLSFYKASFPYRP